MADDASFRLDGRMLVNKGPGLVNVALEAHRVLRRRGPQLLGEEAAMLVMAVGAFHQALHDPVAVRLRELDPNILMAGKAEQWLGSFCQQVLPLLGMVYVMTIDAAHVVDVVGLAGKVAVLF